MGETLGVVAGCWVAAGGGEVGRLFMVKAKARVSVGKSFVKLAISEIYELFGVLLWVLGGWK